MPERLLLIVCGVLAAVLVALRLARTSGRCGERTTTMRRLSDDAGNESLIVTGDIGDIRGAPFLVDTAYAGAPVVSLTFLALGTAFSNTPHTGAHMGCNDAAPEVVQALTMAEGYNELKTCEDIAEKGGCPILELRALHTETCCASCARVRDGEMRVSRKGEIPASWAPTLPTTTKDRPQF